MKIKLFLLFFFSFQLLIQAQEQFSVFFESNKHELNQVEKNRLEKWILENKEVKIVGIHGFCDEDGTTAFNDTLARKRIDFVYGYTNRKIKNRDDFKTRSFGELHQQSKIKAENRKVSLFYIDAKDFEREEEILGIKEEVIVKPIINYPDQLVFDNPNGTRSEFKLDVAFMQQMTQAEVGEKLKLENLNFIINTFAVVQESRGKMYELLLVLQKNPKMKIEIHGHLCCMPIDRLDLSTQRAKAISNFLAANKINKSRLSYKGFGSSQPVFNLPEKNESERAANRRVEILIVEN